MFSEEVCHLKYDNHFVSPSGAWFHPNYINLRIRMVHATDGESLQVLCRLLVKHESAMSRWSRKGSLSRAWYDPLRSITNTVIAMVLLRGTVQLGRNIYSGFRKSKLVHTWKMTSSHSGTP